MTFTREDYMQGKKPPPSNTIIEWKYGVAQSREGKLRAFWSRGQLSQTNILILKTMEAPEDSTLPREKAEELLLKGGPFTKTTQRVQEPPPTPVTLSQGDLCTHSDSEGHHMALIVGVVREMAYAVFLTSTKNWNPYCRPATQEEATMLGQRSSKQSWLAPVVRPLSEFYAKKATVDSALIKQYQIEFSTAYRSRWT